MNHTKWEYTEELGANFSMIADGTFVICGLPNPIGNDTYDKEVQEMRANANLIVSSVNACIEINPNNPQAVAGSIKDMYQTLKGIYKTRNGLPLELAEKTRKIISKIEGR